MSIQNTRRTIRDFTHNLRQLAQADKQNAFKRQVRKTDSRKKVKYCHYIENICKQPECLRNVMHDLNGKYA